MTDDSPVSRSPSFLVLDPDGNRTREEISEFPFTIGRQSSNHLVLRDARASRNHARVTLEEGDFVLEDLRSRHGVFVNGERVERVALKDGDRVAFGFADSIALIFERAGSRVAEIADEFSGRVADAEITRREGPEGNLSRLRAVLEVARALQSSFSLDAVLSAVVDAALVVTKAERGFLMIRQVDGSEAGTLMVRCARSRTGPLRDTELEVPRNLIAKALQERSSTFSMQFDPLRGADPESSAHALRLKSVVCVPLVRIRMKSEAEDGNEAAPGQAIGVLYMDSRVEPGDMAAGNRELLETLGIEASTVLENARLLEEERARQHLHEELAIARGIQQSLLPVNLPATGWVRAAGCSMPSRQVGGDYFDVFRLTPDCWAAVVADVAGKGVSSALVASLLQGAFLAMDEQPDSMRRTLVRLNDFFRERKEGQKYATLFCAQMHRDGSFHYVNAGHCAAILAPLHRSIELLESTSAPVGLLDEAAFALANSVLEAGDRVVIYSDGLTEAQNAEGEFFGKRRVTDVIREHSDRPYGLLHQAILEAVETFTGGQEQADDLTLVVLEYRPD